MAARTSKATTTATKATEATVSVLADRLAAVTAKPAVDLAKLATAAKTVTELPKAPRKGAAENPFAALVATSYAEKVGKAVGPVPVEAVRPVSNAIRRAATAQGISVTLVVEDGPDATATVTFIARDKRPAKKATN
jgi:hypothetical protein